MSQKDLKVLSLNVFGTPFHPKAIVKTFMRNNVRKRFRLIAEEINRTNADILFLQEIIDYPHYIFLLRLLKEYRYKAFKGIFYGPRGGLVILSKFPLEHTIYYDFLEKGKLNNKSVTGHLSVRGILLTQLKGTNLWLGNTHLTQNSDDNWSAGNRFLPLLASQLTQVAVHTQVILSRKEQLILAGDFNVPKGSPLYQNFITESTLQDFFTYDDFSTYHQEFLPPGHRVGRLDYILASPSIKLHDTSYILREQFTDNLGKKFYASDHIGLVARCKIA
ncbi:MAG TPA: endonuclease/exonuclease/phosphatase family protein [Patescibacteria group bacterium]|nr:endonuclease/exonuclease/phosphatase family protein [Patescibacteria group bacterium]